MERLHPVTSKQKVPVYIEVAAIVAVDFGAKSLQNFRLVHPFSDPPNLVVAKRCITTAFDTDIIWILSTPLVRPDNRVVAVDGSRNTRPHTSATITALNERQTAGKCVVHALAFTLTEDSWPATIATCHGPVVLILGQAVNKAVSDQYRLQVDVVFLVA